MLPSKDVTTPAVRRRLTAERYNQQVYLGMVKGQPVNEEAIAHPVDRELMEALDNAHLFGGVWGVL